MTPYYEQDGITIYHGDCMEFLGDFMDERGAKCRVFDLLLTDPPYGIQADKAGAHSSIRDDSRWPQSEWDAKRQTEALALARKICAHGMIWGGNFYSDMLPPSAAWLAWVKPEAETGFSLADMELCWTDLKMSARIKRHPRRDGNYHPTQKPEAVMLWCLTLAPQNVRTVFDPFMGSGTTLVAAKRLRRAATGIEREERYCEIAAKRLQQGALPMEFSA